MCQLCLDAAKKHYPDFTEDEIGELLWNATGFPLVPAEHVEKQIAEARANTDGTLDAAIAYAHEKMDKAMDEFHRNNPIEP